MKKLSVILMALVFALAMSVSALAGEPKSKFKDWVGSKPASKVQIKDKPQTKDYPPYKGGAPLSKGKTPQGKVISTGP